MLPIQSFAISDYDLFTEYPYYLANEEYKQIEINTFNICQEILDSQKGFHEFEAILATIVNDAKSIATSEIGAKLGLNSSYEESIRESAIRKLLAAISAENMSENEYNRKIASEAKKWMGVYKDFASPFKDEAELSSFLTKFLTNLGVDSKNVTSLQSTLVKKVPKLFTAGSQAVNAYQTVLSLTAIYGYRLDGVRVLMDSIDPNSDLYKDLQHTLEQMMDPAKYFNENYTSKAVLGVVQKWIENGTLGKVLAELKKGSETLNNASWVISLCKSLYFTFIYEGYKVDDYAEAVYLLSYETNINSARGQLISKFGNGSATNEDIERYQKLFDLEIIAQIAALHAFSGLLSVYNRYDLKMKAEDQAALLSWNHDYNWYIGQCRKVLEADLSAGKAVKRTNNNQAQPANSNAAVANNAGASTSNRKTISATSIVSEANALVGKYPYVWGGRSPSDGGFDCTGLIYYIYHTRLGYDMTVEQSVSKSKLLAMGTKVTNKADLLPGDIIQYTISHVGIYIGNNTVIHAGSSKGVVKIPLTVNGLTFSYGIRLPNVIQGDSSNNAGNSSTPSTPTNTQPKPTITYADCKVEIACLNGQIVNLYDNPGDTSRVTYFSKGQSSISDYCATLSDGSTWYRIYASHQGDNHRAFWLKYESSKMTVTPRTAGEYDVIKSGTWSVKVPRNYVMFLYDYADSTASYSSYTTSGPYDTQGFLCKQQAILSDGTIRYATGFFEEGIVVTKWFTLTDEMLVEDYESLPTYTVTLNANGGNVSPSTITVRQGGTYGELPQPTRTGYTFTGWYTAAEGGTQVEASNGLSASANHTLYAHWKANGLIASGTWDGLASTSSGSWQLNAEGTLTITAIGTLYKLHNSDGSLAGYEDRVKRVVIEDGSTGIFNLCIGMKNLVNVEMPSSLTSIGSAAFNDCPLLEKITIPRNVSNISFIAFSGCSSLTYINVDGQNPTYRSVDGVVFDKDVNKLIVFPEGRSGNYTIPSDVTTIEYGAFSKEALQNLTTLEIPKSITEIKCDDWQLNYWQNVKLRVYSGSYAEEFAKMGSLNYEVVD